MDSDMNRFDALQGFSVYHLSIEVKKWTDQHPEVEIVKIQYLNDNSQFWCFINYR